MYNERSKVWKRFQVKSSKVFTRFLRPISYDRKPARTIITLYPISSNKLNDPLNKFRAFPRSFFFFSFSFHSKVIYSQYLNIHRNILSYPLIKAKGILFSVSSLIKKTWLSINDIGYENDRSRVLRRL